MSKPMGKGERTRAALVAATRSLIERKGYAATGLSQILEESGAPRGSLYFHFPGGKEELAAAAVRSHADDFGDLLKAVIESAPNALTAAQVALEGLAQQLESSNCDSGCPVGAVALERGGGSAPLLRACREAFDGWIDLIASALSRDGVPFDEARRRARVLLAAIEGSLLLSRTLQTRAPLDDLIESLPSLVSE